MWNTMEATPSDGRTGGDATGCVVEKDVADLDGRTTSTYSAAIWCRRIFTPVGGSDRQAPVGNAMATGGEAFMRTGFSTEGTSRSSRRWLLLVALALTACGTEGVPLGADAPSTSPSTVAVSVTTTPIAPFSVVWSQVIDETPFVEGGYQEMFGVTAGGPGVVAVGLDWSGAGEAVWTSPDGLAWTRVDYDEPSFFGWMLSVTAGGPGLVAVGVDRSSNDVDAAVWTSPDGLTWSRVDDEAVLGGEGDQTEGEGGTKYWTDIVVNEMVMLGSTAPGGGGGGGGGGGYDRGYAPSGGGGGGDTRGPSMTEPDDDLPF